jgi:hypothetical protein
LIDLDSFELFLEQLKGKKGEKDTLDESCDTHDKGNEVALLEKERNLTFILHKKIKLEERKKINFIECSFMHLPLFGYESCFSQP